MKFTLLVLTAGKQAGKKLEIKVSPFLIGRDPECHLRPASPLISKKHCAFTQRGGKVYIQDFESTNGTLVNGEPIAGECELKDKDRVKIGPIELEVALEVAEKTAAAAPAKKAAAPVKKPAPVAAATPAQEETVAEEAGTTREGQDGDDDIADMLLAMGDDGSTTGTATNEAIPDGSTVYDMPIPDEIQAQDGNKDQLQKTKEAQQNTSQAARDILSKYMRRPRGT